MLYCCYRYMSARLLDTNNRQPLRITYRCEQPPTTQPPIIMGVTVHRFKKVLKDLDLSREAAKKLTSIIDDNLDHSVRKHWMQSKIAEYDSTGQHDRDAFKVKLMVELMALLGELVPSHVWQGLK